MKEIYRSFEGKLDVDNRSGVIVYGLKNGVVIDFCNVLLGAWPAPLTRVKLNGVPHNTDWESFNFGEMWDDAFYGRIDGQFYYNGYWRSPRKIMEENRDVHWVRYC